LITMDQLRPGILVSPQAGIDQFSVGSGHFGSILTSIAPVHAEKSGDSSFLLSDRLDKISALVLLRLDH
jgi:hypothetical protein